MDPLRLLPSPARTASATGVAAVLYETLGNIWTVHTIDLAIAVMAIRKQEYNSRA